MVCPAYWPASVERVAAELARHAEEVDLLVAEIDGGDAAFAGLMGERDAALARVRELQNAAVQTCAAIVGLEGVEIPFGEGKALSAAYQRLRLLAAASPEPAKCPDGLLPDGECCPRCGGRRAPSGIDGGTWVHFEPAEGGDGG